MFYLLIVGQESVKYESAQILSGDGVLPWLINTGSEVDKVEQTRSLPTIDMRSRNEFEKCGLAFAIVEAQRDFHRIFPTFHFPSPITRHSS